MSYRNYIEISDDELDANIYRIMSVSRLLQCFKDRHLTLVPPSNWDDPFENLLLKASIRVGKEDSALIAARDQVYGQCWTLHKETDAMWRIYSPEKMGVKVKVKIRNLLKVLQTAKPDMHELRCFIGIVSYVTQKALVKKLHEVDLFNTNGSGIAESLLYKRQEFSHEKEVRLIYTNGKGPLVKVAIDPLELFEEIVFDPRMDDDLVTLYEDVLRKYSFKNRIAKSVLYQVPKNLNLEM